MSITIPPRKTRRVTKRKLLAIDFDRTIFDTDGKDDQPMPGAVEALQRLNRSYDIVVHTLKAHTPSGQAMVADWLREHNISFKDVTDIKPDAVAYIDDKGMKFVDWPTTLELLR